MFAFVPVRPKTNKGFEDGMLSYSKVRAITRVATDDNEEIWLNAAEAELVQEANTWSFLYLRSGAMEGDRTHYRDVGFV